MTVQQIRKQLTVEGYAAVHAHLGGAAIGDQLRAAMQGSAGANADDR